MVQRMTAFVMACGGLTASAGAQCSYEIVTPDPATVYSEVYAISRDGRAMVGRTSTGKDRAYLWTGIGIGQDLGPASGLESLAQDVSADGSVVVGEMFVSGGLRRAFRWTSATGMQSIGTGGKLESVALGVSADGSVAVGQHWEGSSAVPMRWTQSSGMVSLGVLPGYTKGYAQAVSDDGSIVIGVSYNPTSPGVPVAKAFRWTSQTGTQPLPDLGGNESNALDLSSDGHVIVGYAVQPNGVRRSVRWINGILDVLETGPAGSGAVAVTSDGMLILGGQIPVNLGPFIWSEEGGFMELPSFNGAATYPSSVADVGLVFVGAYTVGPQKQLGFRWGSRADCDRSATLTVDDFICFQTLFALGDPNADCDDSGTLSIDDFICFQTTFAIGC